MPKLSVIIPYYNVSKEMFERCIESILKQSYKDYELIIVNDGSNNEYSQYLNEMAKMDDRIILYHKINQGVSSARNFGIVKSHGDYVIFVDADDILVSGFFDEVIKIQQQTNSDFIIGGNVTYKSEEWINDSEDIHYEIYEGKQKDWFKPYLVGDLYRFSNNGYIGRGPWTRLIQRELIVETLFDSNLHQAEDIVWNLDLLNKCHRLCIVDRIWYQYYINMESATHGYNTKIIEQAEEGLKEISKRLNINVILEQNAFRKKMLDEIKKICNCYLHHEKCDLDKELKKREIRKIYTNKPWCDILVNDFYKYVDIKTKIKIILYKFNLLDKLYR